MGSLTLMSKHDKDYLSHYVVGAPISTMIPVFSLANADDISNKLKKRFIYTYELSDKSVGEKLLENSKLIDKNTFDEFFYPSLIGDGYVSRAEKYLGDCVDMKQLMLKRSAPPSLLKPNDADVMYAMDKVGFLNNVRESYVV